MKLDPRYAHYVCDECDAPLGVDGAVVLSRTNPVVVMAARCEEHRKRPAAAGPTTSKETR